MVPARLGRPAIHRKRSVSLIINVGLKRPITNKAGYGAASLRIKKRIIEKPNRLIITCYSLILLRLPLIIVRQT